MVRAYEYISDLILRSAPCARLEGWAASSSVVSMLREAAKRPLLRMRAALLRK
jgi:hypothetical protein